MADVAGVAQQEAARGAAAGAVEGDQGAQFVLGADAGADIEAQAGVGPEAAAPLEARCGHGDRGGELGRHGGVAPEGERIGN